MDVFVGRITSTGFSSGDRIVIGDWKKSHLGSFTNLMWAKEDGTRVLLSPSRKHAEFVSGLYNFDEVMIVDVEVERGRGVVSVSAGDLSVKISWGVAFPLPLWRPLWFIASIEAFFGRLVFGTRTHGETRDGRREWYSVRSISRVIKAEAYIDGRSLGGKARFQTKAGFGFSEPPSIPASVYLKTYIE